MHLENRALVNYIKFYYKKIRISREWWLRPVIPALHRLRPTNYCKYIREEPGYIKSFTPV